MTIDVAAVAFDYGEVLSGPQDRVCVGRLCELTGLRPGEFEAHYRAERLAYDRGTLTPEAYWGAMLSATGRVSSAQLISALVATDAAGWMGTDARVLRWADRIATSGRGLAILSNMPESVRAPIVSRHQSWLAKFAVRIFSCDVGFAKPDAEIYELLCARLGERPERVLFIDDNVVNVDGAKRFGLRTIHYGDFRDLDEGLSFVRDAR